MSQKIISSAKHYKLKEKKLKGYGESIVNVESSVGSTVISKGSPLKRLNYFDGKFLRAPDLITEQRALLNQIRISNQAGGYGVVHGYDCTLNGDDSLQISAGFAIDSAGKVLLLGEDANVEIDELIATSSGTSVEQQGVSIDNSHQTLKAEFADCVLKTTNEDGSVTSESTDIYLITLHHVEAYCGEEDVYGKLCSEACATSKNRSYIIEGVEVRATPLNLSVLLKQSSSVSLTQKHLRSRIAAAYYEEERLNGNSHISGSGLSSSLWCLGAEPQSRNGVPIAVLGRSGHTTTFLDAWIARRERMETPPRHYWSGIMQFRSWNIFLAQILQFQCQLRHCLTSKGSWSSGKGAEDPCAETKKTATETAENMLHIIQQMEEMAEQLEKYEQLQGKQIKQQIHTLEKVKHVEKIEPYSKSVNFSQQLSKLQSGYKKLVDVAGQSTDDRLLINCGFVEVPSGGYLPVKVNSDLTVNEQIKRQFGPGVDLRFCVVRPDYVAHALEEVQHMERICLLKGIDDPTKLEEVDVLVPNGEIIQQEHQQGIAYQASVSINTQAFMLGWPKTENQDKYLSQALYQGDYYLRAGKYANAGFDFSGLEGAARGDKTDNNGFVFYCAAQSGHQLATSHSLSIQQAQHALSIADAAPQTVLQLLGAGVDDSVDKSVEENAKAAKGDDNKDSISDHSINLSAGSQIHTNYDAIIKPSLGSFWVELKTDKDPFSLNEGDTTDIQAKIVMVVTASDTSSRIEERSITGQLHIKKSASGDESHTKLSGRLIGDGIWKKTQTGGVSKSTTEHIDIDEEINIVKSASGVGILYPSVQVELINPSFFANMSNVRLVATRQWISTTESRMRLVLQYQDKVSAEDYYDAIAGKAASLYESYATPSGMKETVLADTVLKQAQGENNPLLPGNPYHSVSLQALDHIGQATKYSGFADNAGKLLFPPKEESSSSNDIMAKESWVLFHRRRDNSCNVCPEKVVETKPETPPEVKPRQYRVYHIDLPAETVIDKLSKNLVKDIANAIAQFQINPVTTVEYEKTLASVTNSHNDVRTDWQNQVQVSSDVHIGIIASEGDVLTEGSALASSRLQSLTNVLSPVAETADNLKLLNAETVPASLSSPENDGVIIYFTKAVATICHRVFGVRARSRSVFLKNTENYLKSGKSIDQVTSTFRKCKELNEHASFLKGSDQFHADNQAQKLQASWQLKFNAPINAVLTLGANETNPEKVISKNQGLNISKAMGYDITSQGSNNHFYRGASENFFSGCPKATFLLIKTQCHDLYTLQVPVRDASSFETTHLESLTTMIRDSGFNADLLNFNADGRLQQYSSAQHIGEFDFYDNSNAFDEGEQQRLSQNWVNLLGGRSSAGITGYYVTISRSGDDSTATQANLDLAKSQAASIAATMNINTRGMLAEINNAEADFPVGCDSLTLLVIPRIVENPGNDHVMVVPNDDLPPEGDKPEEDKPDFTMVAVPDDHIPDGFDPEVTMIAVPGDDPKPEDLVDPEVTMVAVPGNDPKPEDDKPEVTMVAVPGNDPKPEDLVDPEVTMVATPGNDPKLEDFEPEVTMVAAPGDDTPFVHVHAELAEAIHFDDNNEVVKDEALMEEVGKLLGDGKSIHHVELINTGSEVDEAEEIKANSMLEFFKAEGLVAADADIAIREATEVEKVEMEKSGFALGKGILLSE